MPNTQGPFSLLAMLAALFAISPLATSQAEEVMSCDPAEVLGAAACAKCHASEVRQWKQTPHFETLETLHRKPAAKEIAKRLGLRSVKRNDTCVKCHFTQQTVGDRLRVVAGVSCESCHGAAKNWVKLHNDYGGPNTTKEMELPEHRRQRRLQSVAAGMNNPSNLYLVARQCLACHTTPDEQLVNVGGHTAGSSKFELVSWSQGMTRHNFLSSDGKANRPSSPSRLRVMYVVGVLADLEASLRATAIATTKASFGIAAAQRAAGLKHRLNEIHNRVDNAHVEKALDAALAVRIKLNNSAALIAAADEIGRAAYEFADSETGETLAPLDALIPGPEQYIDR